MKKSLSVLLAIVMLLGMTPFATAEETADSYTYNTSMSASPLNWNPHAWEMSNESDFMTFIDAPLVDVTIAEDGVNFEWIYEMADAVTDVTADFADKEAWGIPADATEGWVFTIDLNKEARWQDGAMIDADDYIYSMQQLLDPAMKNYRANSYFSGDTAIAGANGYYNNDQAGQTKYAQASTENDDSEMFVSMTEECYFFGDSAATYYEAGYVDYFMNGDEDLYAKYSGETYIPLTDEVKADLLVLAQNFGDDNELAYVEFCFVEDGVYEATPWEEVGLLKTGDYQLTWIMANQSSLFYMLSNLTSGWLVNEELYEAGKSTVENLVATDYATSMETYSATGPYKIVSFEKDKQIVLEKNENWFGNFDGRHDGQYQATRVVIDIVGEHTTELMLFNQGKLDETSLTGDDMATYRMSDYLMKTDQTYTFRWIFATDLDALKALEEEANDGANKRVLYYDDFRKAISLSMDRETFATQATSAYKPAYYLLNSLYYYDMEHDSESIYRNTTEAKEAVLRLYGIEYGEGTNYATVDDAYAAVTGYDVEAARELFQSVYEQAIADGNYTDGQAININCMASAASSLTADDTKQQDLMNQFVADATKGTGFEGKITFTFKSGAEDRYSDVANGRIEMIRGAWGGAAFYPFSTIRVYCEPIYMGGLDLIHESCGWNPETETLDITYDFDGDGTAETVTDTFQNWALAINAGGAYAADMNTCMVVLSNLESGILGAYQCIPWATETLCTMHSQKIEYATYDYNIMYGYGGLRLMTFNYTDAEWEEYVAEQGGQLNYE